MSEGVVRVLVVAGLFVSLPFIGLGNTINAAGNWDNTAIWSGSNIADAIGEDVTMNNNLGTITVRNTFSYTVGNVNMGNGNTLLVQAGATLTLGASGNAKNFTTNNSTTINVAGDLIIWGDLVVNNNLVLIVSGSLTVKGDVQINNGGNLNISGNATIDGDFTGGNNTALTVDGGVSVGGNVSVGNGSTIGGTGSMTVGGTCADGSSTFCGTGPLPVTLIFFEANISSGAILLTWATASELNFDHFAVERSVDGVSFAEIGRVQGHGTTNARNDYSLYDNNPTIGKLYYRLKSVDFDGYTEYFPIVSIEFSEQRSIVFYPNPVTEGRLNFQTNFLGDQNVEIQATDGSGTTVLKYITSPIQNDFSVPISLSPGVYFFQINSAGFKQAQRIVVK